MFYNELKYDKRIMIKLEVFPELVYDILHLSLQTLRG